MATVAFIGLGNMGGGMAINLAKAGHTVRAVDLSAEAVAKAVAGGAEDGGTVAAAVAGAEAVVTMLPAGKHVQGVYNEVFEAAPSGTLCLDCSTIDVDTARAVNAAAAERGFEMVDAPVSGGTAAADGGTLTFMVGGTKDAFAKAEVFLASMGKTIVHAGDAGAGQAAKICNNMLLAITMIGTCEAFAMAEKLGLEAQTFYDIAMMLKDLKLAMGAAASADAAAPMGALAEALYQAYSLQGNSLKDFSGIINFLK